MASTDSPFNIFLRTGRFANVGPGANISTVIDALGEADDTGRGGKGWRGLQYGDTQVWWYRDEPVYSFGIYFRGNPNVRPLLPSQLNCEVPFTGNTTKGDFEIYLNNHGITCTPDTRLPGGQNFRVGSSVIASFIPETLLLDSIIASRPLA